MGIDDITESAVEKANAAGKMGCSCAKAGCGAVVMVMIGSWILGKIAGCVGPTISGCTSSISQKFESCREEYRINRENRQKAARAQAEAKAERERLAQRRRKVEEFAAKESPRLLKTLRALQAEVETQTVQIADLEKTLFDFGKNPLADSDYLDICAKRDDLSRTVDRIITKLEEAYIAAKKFEATPGSVDYDTLRRKAIEDGLKEADAATMKFEKMRKAK